MNKVAENSTDSPVVVLISGGPGSGKSTLAHGLSSATGWVVVSFGQYVRDLASQRQIEPNRENLQNLGESLILQSHEAFTEKALKHFGWVPGQGAIVEGVRHIEVIAALRSITLPVPMTWIFIQVADETQEARVLARGDRETISPKIRLHTTEKQVADFRPLADCVLDGAKPESEVLSLACSHVFSAARNKSA